MRADMREMPPISSLASPFFEFKFLILKISLFCKHYIISIDMIATTNFMFYRADNDFNLFPYEYNLISLCKSFCRSVSAYWQSVSSGGTIKSE